MTNACCCIDYDDGFAVVSQDTQRRARKAHLCAACGSSIAVGSTYMQCDGLCDGHWLRDRVCVPCYRIAQTMFPCGYCFETMRADFLECHGWDYVTGKERKP